MRERLEIRWPSLLLAGVCALAPAARAQEVIPQTLIVQGDLCAGTDCSSTESFGLDILKIKHNNTKLLFDDSSTTAEPLDPRAALQRVVELPVSLWSYKADGAATRHLGPMAEDFHQAFGLGADEKHIAPGDQAGVALLALQGLNQVVAEKDRLIAELAARVEALEKVALALAKGLGAAEK